MSEINKLFRKLSMLDYFLNVIASIPMIFQLLILNLPIRVFQYFNSTKMVNKVHVYMRVVLRPFVERIHVVLSFDWLIRPELIFPLE